MHDASDKPGPTIARRTGVLVLAVLQLAAAVALPAVDGVLDIERFAVPVHVEAPGSDDCTPHHDHAFCQVVRATAMANPSRVAITIDLGLPLTQLTEPEAAAEITRSGRLFQGSAGPRAPPSA